MTAAVLIGIAAVAMFDTRAGAIPDPSAEGVPGGLKGGWYPFWSAALGAATLLVVFYRTATIPQPEQPLFAGGRAGALDVLRLILPIIVLVLLMDRLLGFYLAGGLYLAYFGRVVGGYRWVWVAASAVAIPVLLYYLFEIFFKVSLPKSIWYTLGFPV